MGEDDDSPASPRQGWIEVDSMRIWIDSDQEDADRRKIGVAHRNSVTPYIVSHPRANAASARITSSKLRHQEWRCSSIRAPFTHHPMNASILIAVQISHRQDEMKRMTAPEP